MNIFVLEDDQNRVKKFKRELIGYNVDYATTVVEGVKCIANKKYDLIFLDHDLGGLEMVDSNSSEGTGYHVAIEISYSKNDNTLCIIHSCNPPGAIIINKTLKNSKIVPFISLDIQKEIALIEGDQNEFTD